MNATIHSPDGRAASLGWPGIATTILATSLLLTLSACSTTKQVSQGVGESGFLSDYSQLQKGVKDRADYSYWNPNADWSKYTKVYIKPVELWKSDQPDSPFKYMTHEQQEMLVSALHTALYESLSTNYQMVDEPGPNTMVIRAAITEETRCKPVLDLVSSVYPQAVVLSYGKQVIWGTGTGVGSVTVEGEILDGQTGERLAAAVDRRAGTKAWRTKFGGWWGDIKLCFDWWGNRLNQRLQEEKDATASKDAL